MVRVQGTILVALVTSGSTARFSSRTGSCAVYGCWSDYDGNYDCQCNSNCGNYGNCCSDFVSLCKNGGSPSPSPPVSPTPLPDPTPSPSPTPPDAPGPPAGPPSDDAMTYWEGVNMASKSAVKARLNNGFRKIGYRGLWTAYKSVWVGLPGRCTSGGMYEIYSQKCWAPGTGQCGSYKKEGDCYNREHSWPKSWWGGGKNDAYSDIYHVMPSDGYVNSKRSNLPFGEVSSVSFTSSEGHKTGSCAGGDKCFEPVARTKGVVARGHLYVNVKYGYSMPSWTERLMLKWHSQYPPTGWEAEFNNRAADWQENRNPFIDYPEEAAQMFR